MPVLAGNINTERTGDVWLEDFDRGVVETMGATIVDDDYFLSVDGVKLGNFAYDHRNIDLRDQQMPGVHVIFASPDDRVQSFVFPCVVIRRESVEPAPQRWPSHHLKYQAPAPGASESTISFQGQDLTGWSSYEEQMGSFPYDLTYMISVLAQGERSTRDAQRMLKKVLRVYPPRALWGGVTVKDTVGGERLYETFSEGPVSLKEALDVADRQAGFSVTIRVEGELDLADPYFTTSVTSVGYNEDML